MICEWYLHDALNAQFVNTAYPLIKLILNVRKWIFLCVFLDEDSAMLLLVSVNIEKL